MNLNHLITIVAVCFPIDSVLSGRKSKVTITQVHLKSRYTEIANTSMELVNTATHNYLNANGTVLYDLTDNLYYSVTMHQYKDEYQRYTVFIRNFTIDVCKMFQHIELPSLARIVWDELYKFTDLPPRCPIRIGDYHLRNFTMKGDSIPAYIPHGRYKMDLIFYQNYQKKQRVGFQLILYAIFGPK